MVWGIVPATEQLSVSILEMVAVFRAVEVRFCHHVLSNVQFELVEEEQPAADVALVEIDFCESELG